MKYLLILMMLAPPCFADDARTNRIRAYRAFRSINQKASVLRRKKEELTYSNKDGQMRNMSNEEMLIKTSLFGVVTMGLFYAFRNPHSHIGKLIQVQKLRPYINQIFIEFAPRLGPKSLRSSAYVLFPLYLGVFVAMGHLDEIRYVQYAGLVGGPVLWGLALDRNLYRFQDRRLFGPFSKPNSRVASSSFSILGVAAFLSGLERLSQESEWKLEEQVIEDNKKYALQLDRQFNETIKLFGSKAKVDALIKDIFVEELSIGTIFNLHFGIPMEEAIKIENELNVQSPEDVFQKVQKWLSHEINQFRSQQR